MNFILGGLFYDENIAGAAWEVLHCNGIWV